MRGLLPHYGDTSPAASRTTDTVDLETLCQVIEPPSRYDLVDLDRLSWPIRNRDGLLAALRGDQAIAQAEPRALDSDDRSLLQLESFLILDRPLVEAEAGLTGPDLPWSKASCSLIKTFVYLEAVDDGRLDRLIDRFHDRCGTRIFLRLIPRTKIIGHLPRHELALAGRWHIPPGLTPEDDDRLRQRAGCPCHRRDLAQDAAPVTAAAEPAPGWTGR